jgi:hypothetical protein
MRAHPRLAPAVDTDDEKVLNVYNWSDYIDPPCSTISRRKPASRSTTTSSTPTSCSRPSCSRAARAMTSWSRRRQLPGAPDQGRRVPEARQVEAAQPQEHGSEITKRLALHDPGNEYSVNYIWGTSGVGYNEAKIKEAMPDAPVDSFAMFYDPKVARSSSRLRRDRAGCALRNHRHSADLPRQGCQQRKPRRPGRRREGAAGDPPVHPLRQLLEVHRGSRQRRDLPRARLVGRRAAGPRRGPRRRARAYASST